MRRNGFRRVALVGLAVSGIVLTCLPVLAACGDGVVEGTEQCDDGSANGTDGCCSASCTLVDRDGDGLCDALDSCDLGNGLRIKETKLVARRLLSPPGDDALRFTGTITVPSRPAIDPSASGMRLTLYSQQSGPLGEPPRYPTTLVLDATLPGGERWRRSPSGTTFSYRDPRGEAAGITRAKLKLLAPLIPTPNLIKVAFSILGRHGDYAITPAMVDFGIHTGGGSMMISLALGDLSPTNQQCGQTIYFREVATHCDFSASGDSVACMGPPPVGPCHLGDPDDLMFCDLLDAAHAADRYFAEHGTYLTGPCTDLPSFVPSPGVSCSASASATSFVVTTWHPLALLGSCTWIGNPAPGNPNFVCS